MCLIFKLCLLSVLGDKLVVGGGGGVGKGLVLGFPQGKGGRGLLFSYSNYCILAHTWHFCKHARETDARTHGCVHVAHTHTAVLLIFLSPFFTSPLSSSSWIFLVLFFPFEIVIYCYALCYFDLCTHILRGFVLLLVCLILPWFCC